tara:strand:- start:748 stop:1290 length:543 start_codon:yes stop_codon:yes gene_type:complete
MGSIHLIIGPMFSGKTTKLIEISKSAKNSNTKFIALNYFKDVRYSNNKITTHDGLELDCIMIKNLKDILQSQDFIDSDLVLINEGQFFKDLREFCLDCIELNKTVIVCGLNGDFKMESFEEISEVIPICETIQYLISKCIICKDGTPASFTKRLIDNNEKVLIGSDEYYAPVCRKCHKST